MCLIPMSHNRCRKLPEVNVKFEAKNSAKFDPEAANVIDWDVNDFEFSFFVFIRLNFKKFKIRPKKIFTPMLLLISKK